MRRFQWLAASAGTAVALGLLLSAALFSPDVPFVLQDPDAPWITLPYPVSLATHLGGRGAETRVVFARRFSAQPGASAGALELDSLGSVELTLNGGAVPLPAGDRACFKRACRADVGALLRAGPNEIRAAVRSERAPPLLRLRLETGATPLTTDTSWLADDQPAAVADDTRPFADALSQPTVAEALRARAGPIALLAALSAGLFLAAQRLLPARLARGLPAAALAAATLFWVWVFGAKSSVLPLEVGYDARYHIQYVSFLLEAKRLPLATEGVAMYHPPLFYAAAAALAALGAPLRLVPFLSGLGMVWIAAALARRAFPGDTRAVAFSALAAGFLPVNVYVSAYISNEPLFAFLTGASLLVAADVCLAPRASPGRLALLAGLLGLSAATKYTAWITIPIVVGGVGLALFYAQGAGLRRTALACGGVVAGAGLLSGWIYVRNWIHFRDPFVWNLDLPGGLTYWQQPGFHTPAYYLSFGESLRRPYFSLFRSFWDAVYSTVWGVGNPPAVYSLAERHELWNYGWMTAGYALALPATALALLGVGVVAARALRGADLPRRALLTLVLALLFAMAYGLVQGQLRFPLWGGARAAYVLAGVVPFALCAGVGLAAADRWLARPGRLALRALFYAWLGTFLAAVAASYGA